MVGAPGVAHAGAQAAHHLEDGVRQGPLVGHTTLYAFGHELFCSPWKYRSLLPLPMAPQAAHARYTP